MSKLYSFDIPGPIIWFSHILIGLFLIYLGYNILNNENISHLQASMLFTLGVLALLYHVHLWYVN